MGSVPAVTARRCPDEAGGAASPPGADGSGAETLTEALVRKTPPRGETVVDGQTGEEYHAE